MDKTIRETEVPVERLRNCARCNKTHKDLVFRKLLNPIGEMTHWTMCPNNNEPILLMQVSE